MVSAVFANARDIDADLDWFSRVLAARMQQYFVAGDTQEHAVTSMHAIYAIEPPRLLDSSHYARFVAHYEMSFAERLVLVLALIPHVRPQLLDILWQRNEATGRGFSQFGGWGGNAHGGFLPTGETAAFILAGDDLALRFDLIKLFDGEHFFASHNILSLASVATEEPRLSGAIAMASEFLYWFTTGVERKPNFNSGFPARLIDTQRQWDDLVLPQSTRDQFEEIKHWILHRDVLLNDWGFGKKLNPGFVSLFYGPPGTGKTLSACLLGKQCGCDVYKIDLSMVVSKYIGETEKNLARVFDLAENRNWILFFDEADALFGKRTRVDDAHDRYANQEISFLLQRIEDFSGVVILASNLKANIDDAFLRRFHSVVYFPLPRPSERLQIWSKAFSAKTQLETAVDLQYTADKYDLAGGTIMNVVRYSSLKALSRNTDTIRLEDIEEGIRREFQKEGRNV